VERLTAGVGEEEGPLAPTLTLVADPEERRGALVDALNDIITKLGERFAMIVFDCASEPWIWPPAEAVSDIVVEIVERSRPGRDGDDGRRSFEVLNLCNAGTERAPVSACAPFVLPVDAALANVRELRRGPYLANARALGPVLEEGLLAIQRRHPAQAGCVHVKGLVGGIQIVKPGTREPDGVAALRINVACFHKGLLMFAPVGVAGECIKIAPALDTSREALDEGLAVLGEAMDEVLG